MEVALKSESKAVLLKALRSLYDLSQENRDFLHAKFLRGDGALEPYRQTIGEALYPDMFSKKPISIATARKAISQYKKATNDEMGVLELMVYFVERGNQCTVDLGDIDESFYLSLESMFDRVLNTLQKSSEEITHRFLPRLIAVRDAASGIGWGYYDHLCCALEEAFPEAVSSR